MHGIHHVTMTCLHITYIPHTSTNTQCKLYKSKLQQVLTTTCANGVFVLVDGRKSTNSASCKK